MHAQIAADLCTPGSSLRLEHEGRPNLQIRRYLFGHPDPFRSVRDLGLVSPGCTGGSGASEGCSSVWLPAWLPAGPLSSIEGAHTPVSPAGSSPSPASTRTQPATATRRHLEAHPRPPPRA